MLARLFQIAFILIMVVANSNAQFIDTLSLILDKEWKVDKGYWGGSSIILAKEIDSTEVLKEDSEFIKTWSFLNKFTPTIIFRKNRNVEYYKSTDCPVGENIQFFSSFEMKEGHLYIQHKEINWDNLDKYRKKITNKENILGYEYEYNIPYDTLKYKIEVVTERLIILKLWDYKGKIEDPSNYKTLFYKLKER